MALSKLVAVFAIALSAVHASAEMMQEEHEFYQQSARERGRLTLRRQFMQEGGFELIGQPSAAQVFGRGKLVPCSITRDPISGAVTASRSSCDESRRIYVPLSNGVLSGPVNVPQGLYLFGYENSIYPGYVVVHPGQTTRITLDQIPIPAGGTVKVFRDLTTLDEQKKIYFTTFTMGKTFFKLGEWAFGDLYVQKVGNLNAPPSLDYAFCEQASLPDLTAKGDRLCRAWNQPSFMSVMEMFDFRNDSRFFQWEVRRPGKPYAYRFNRLLVAKATTSNRASFVNVLPGSYVIEVADAKGKATTSAVKVGQRDHLGQLTTAFGQMPDPATLALNGLAILSTTEDEGLQPGENCVSAKMWRTESRAHCKADAQEGCDRNQALLCEPMIPDLQ